LVRLPDEERWTGAVRKSAVRILDQRRVAVRAHEDRFGPDGERAEQKQESRCTRRNTPRIFR
jgi:hypothetical protein